MKEPHMLVITLGDPYSVNCEIVHSALRESQLYKKYPTVLIGSYNQWERQTRWTVQQTRSLQASSVDLWFYDIGGKDKDASTFTELERGEIAKNSLEALHQLDVSQKFAVIT